MRASHRNFLDPDEIWIGAMEAADPKDLEPKELVIGGRYIPIDREQDEFVVMQIGRRR